MKVETDMDWVEYSNYIFNTTDFTKNQAFAVGGKSYGIDDDEIAEEVDSTEETIRVQRSRIEYNDIDEVKKPEFFNKPVPNTPFKLVGSIDYFHTDYWPKNSNSGDAYIYVATKQNDSYVVVIEKVKVTEKSNLQNPDESGVLAVVNDVKTTKIYENMESFLDNSVHSPFNVPDDENQLHISTEGELYS